MSLQEVQLIECPRDAMQGWKQLISTADKVTYLNALLRVGFHTIDFGSFVSPAAIPQMADASRVIEELDLENTSSKLLAIVANVRGAVEAAAIERIDVLGFPFSLSETFQQRNANSSIAQAFDRLRIISDLAQKNSKQLVVYLSMGFGNPFNDPYDEHIVYEWAEKIKTLDIDLISIADTIGIAGPEAISRLSAGLISTIGATKFGLHLHSTPSSWKQKVEAAWQAGCRRFDGALMGIGGCPMASDELTGNLDTLNLISFFKSKDVLAELNEEALTESVAIARSIFQRKNVGS